MRLHEIDLTIDRIDKIKTHNNISTLPVIAIALLAGINVIYSSNLTTLFLWLIVGFSIIYNPVYSIVGWIIFLPLENYFRNYGGVNPYLGLSILAFLSIFIFLLKERNLNIKKDMLIFILLLFFSGFLSGIGGTSSALMLIRNVFSLMLLISVFFVITIVIERYNFGFIMVEQTICCAAILATIIAINSSVSWRLSVGDNVRSLANILGLVIIILSMTILKSFATKSTKKSILNYHINIILRLMLIIFFTIILIMTMSRGTLVATGIGIFSGITFDLLSNKRRNKEVKISNSRLLFIVFLLIVFLFLFLNSNFFYSIGGERLIYRFQQPHSENIRMDLWRYGVSQLQGIQWIFGAGIGKFEDLVSSGGYSLYAHSVFVDSLISLGTFGLTTLILFIFRIAYKLWKAKTALGIALLVYMVFTFSTHGTLYTKYFWLNLALIYGVSCKKNK